jgi:hypothetical protein
MKSTGMILTLCVLLVASSSTPPQAERLDSKTQPQGYLSVEDEGEAVYHKELFPQGVFEIGAWGHTRFTCRARFCCLTTNY